MIPLQQAIGLLLAAGYSAIRYFPTSRHPIRLYATGLDKPIHVVDDKIPTRSLPTPTPAATPLARVAAMAS